MRGIIEDFFWKVVNYSFLFFFGIVSKRIKSFIREEQEDGLRLLFGIEENKKGCKVFVIFVLFLYKKLVVWFIVINVMVKYSGMFFLMD